VRDVRERVYRAGSGPVLQANLSHDCLSSSSQGESSEGMTRCEWCGRPILPYRADEDSLCSLACEVDWVEMWLQCFVLWHQARAMRQVGVES
jgi:hypothetical protein